MIVKQNGRIVRQGGRVIGGIVTLEYTGRSATFPFAIANNSGVNSGVGNLALQFNKQTAITVDYGNGVVKTFVSVVSPGESVNRFVFNSNDYFSSFYDLYHPKYIYPDGEVKQRTVKVSYNRENLTSYSGGINGVTNIPVLNFLFYAHRNLTFFSTSGAAGTLTDIPYLDRITASTNPVLQTLRIVNFSANSPWVRAVPINFLDMPLTLLTTGTTSFTDTGSNLEHIGSRAIKNSLISLELIDLINVTTLPASLDGVVKLRDLTLNRCSFAEFPEVITRLTTLQSLIINDTTNRLTGMSQIPASIANLNKLVNFSFNIWNVTKIPDNVNLLTTIVTLTISGGATFTEFGDISALKNMATLVLAHPTIHNSFTAFPAYFDAFTKFRTVTFNSPLNSASVNVTKKLSLIYDLITRNAPKTGVNNGSIPYRGFILNLFTGSAVPTAVDGIIAEPEGFVQGVENGVVDSAGKMIWVLRNQYGCTINITV